VPNEVSAAAFLAPGLAVADGGSAHTADNASGRAWVLRRFAGGFLETGAASGTAAGGFTPADFWHQWSSLSLSLPSSTGGARAATGVELLLRRLADGFFTARATHAVTG
jgi:hypothetical protein